MMPKLSIYVQDELWDRARAAEPKLNPSQVVQAALRQFIDKLVDRPPYARVRPNVADAVLAEVKVRLAKEARERYEHGFRSGLELGTRLPWHHIDHLAERKGDLRQWLNDELEYHHHMFGDSNTPLFVVLSLDEGIVHDLTVDLLPVFEQQPTFRRGVVDALQEVWNGVMQTEDEGAASPSPRPVD